MWKYREVKKWEQFWCWTALWECEHRWRLLYDKCQCECWTIKFVHHDHLIHWRTTNCWCKMYEVRSKNGKMNKRHGMEWTRPYKIFMSAKQRCQWSGSMSYKRYGGRWIKMEWNSFDEFWNDMWASYIEHVKEYWEKQTTIERINVDWNYCKENCRWATWKEQYQNTSLNKILQYKWKTYYSIRELWEAAWINRHTLASRLRKWMTIDEAINQPLIYLWKNVKKV